MQRLSRFVTFTVVVSCSGAALAQESAPTTTVPFPHPVISEALAQVPNTNDVDPSRDNVREPVGDEFVELVNPHDRAIDLTGYAIVDALAIAKPEDERGVRFVFPRFTLGPGECVVVFNGYQTGVMGEHGNSVNAPKERNGKFHDAWVFSMNNATRFRALNNSDEIVAIVDPSGKVIDALVWGDPDVEIPEGALRVTTVRRTSGASYVRASAEGEVGIHTKIAPGNPAAYSPGRPFAGGSATKEE